MKIILSVLLILFATTITAQFTGISVTNAPSLIIVAGESNAGNFGANDSLSAGEKGLRNKVIYFDTTTLLFSQLNISSTPGATHGLENGIANCADSGKLGTRDFYVLRTGRNNAKIADWQNLTAVPAWTNFVIRADSAIKTITALHGVPPAIHFVWFLGINNMSAGDPVLPWKDSTISFFKKVRDKYGFFPIYMTELPISWNTYNDQIVLLPAQVRQLYVIPSRNYELNNLDIRHFSQTGLKRIAADLVQILNYRYQF